MKAAVLSSSYCNSLPVCHTHAIHTQKTPTFSPTKHLLTISLTHKLRHYVSVSGGHSQIAKLQPSILLTPLCHLCGHFQNQGQGDSLQHNKGSPRGRVKSTEERQNNYTESAIFSMWTSFYPVCLWSAGKSVSSVSYLLREPEASPLLLWLLYGL